MGPYVMMTKPLLKLEEDCRYTAGADDYVITEENSFEDILLHVIEHDCPGMTREAACQHLIELLEYIAKTEGPVEPLGYIITAEAIRDL
jgi:hypothetical protein